MINFSKTETEILDATIEFARILETVWISGRSHSSGDYVRPLVPNGFEYECTTGGQTGSREPKWPTTVAGTVADGSVTWTARAFSTNATDTISSVNTEAPAGITVGTATPSGTEVVVPISGGTRNGCYTVSLEVTTAGGEVIEEKLRVTVYDD